MDRRRGRADTGTDEQILVAFLDGDDQAFGILVERHHQELFQFVARFVRNAAAAEDAVQEAFIQAHRSARSFDASRRFRPWLYTIAANKARDYLRGRARRREVPLSIPSASDASEDVSYLDFLSDDATAAGEVMEGDERRDAVRAIVSEMPDNLREILVLGYYQRLPYKEIAEVLAIPLGTVKSRLHAAVSCFATAYKRQQAARESEPG